MRSDYHCGPLAVCCLMLSGWAPCLAQIAPPPRAAPPDITGGAAAPVVGQPGIMNQPVVISTFESVEMERLRLAEEVAKMERDELDFREQVARLQAKLGGLSLSGMTPASMPSEYRSFISANAADIKKTDAYYAQLKSLLNDLTPDSPYRSRLTGDSSNPQQASEKLNKLSEYREDDDICRTIRGHIASLAGGRVDDMQRRTEIDRQLIRLAGERRRLEWNLRMANGVNSLSGQERATEDERAYIRKQIDDVAREVQQLEDEKKNLSHLVTAAVRKLQFQQFIIELAVQQRYIHSLIASGFYRNSFGRGDLKISGEAYPSSHSSRLGKSGETTTADDGFDPGRPKEKPDGQPENTPASAAPQANSSTTNGSPAAALPLGAPVSSLPATELPVISTITGLESFLLNRIRDAIKDREAIDNMLREGQISAAESVLRKMLLTAKYQPELQTLPYADRQKIQRFAQNVKKLSDALNARDYPEISRLASDMEKDGTDAGASDLKVFAAEHPRKALHWAKQAELALKADDRKAARSLMEAAIRRAPLDPEVARKIDQLQGDAIENSNLGDSLEDIVKRQDYRAAFDRMNEFAPLAATSKNPQLKADYEALLEREKALRAALEKCDELERRGNAPEAWITLGTLEAPVAGDPRVNERKGRIAGKAPRFVSCYTTAVEREQSGKAALALAWYLSALADAPGNEQLQAKVTALGNRLLKN